MRQERRFRIRRRVTGALAVAIVVAPVGFLTYSCVGGGDSPPPAAPDTTSPTSTSTSTTEAPRLVAGLDGILCPPRPEGPRAKVAYLLLPSVTSDGFAAAEAALTSPERPSTMFIKGDVNPAIRERIVRLRKLTGATFVIDDEGGTVQGLKDVAGNLPSAVAQSALDAASLRSMFAERARAMRDIGISWNFAPVVDLRGPAAANVLEGRTYGDTVSEVVADAEAVVAGLHDGGVTATLKHFPGHGSASGDSHFDVVTTPPLDQLRASDLQAFARMIGGSIPVTMMVGHLDVPGLTEPGVPASLSAATYRLLREELGFTGLAVTDSLGMEAVTRRVTPTEAAAAALVAGADVALLPENVVFAEAVDATLARVGAGELTEARLDESVRRLRGVQGCADA